VSGGSKPTYDLEKVKEQVRAGKHRITGSAFQGACALQLDQTDIADCVLALDEGDFFKTMVADSGLGKMQDVYRPTFQSTPVYLKLQHDDAAWVISFKKDLNR
jgi:hypothetical protein